MLSLFCDCHPATPGNVAPGAAARVPAGSDAAGGEGPTIFACTLSLFRHP